MPITPSQKELFHQKLNRFLIDCNTTPSQLAQMLAVPYTTVKSWISGARGPRPRALYAACRKLNWNIEDFKADAEFHADTEKYINLDYGISMYVDASNRCDLKMIDVAIGNVLFQIATLLREYSWNVCVVYSPAEDGMLAYVEVSDRYNVLRLYLTGKMQGMSCTAYDNGAKPRELVNKLFTIETLSYVSLVRYTTEIEAWFFEKRRKQ